MEVRRSGMSLGINSGSAPISILDGDGKDSAGINFGKNDPSLNLQDANGFSAVLGTSQVENPNRQTQQTSAASLILLDNNEKVIWRAP
jgi:hypothetical protein